MCWTDSYSHRSSMDTIPRAATFVTLNSCCLVLSLLNSWWLVPGKKLTEFLVLGTWKLWIHGDLYWAYWIPGDCWCWAGSILPVTAEYRYAVLWSCTWHLNERKFCLTYMQSVCELAPDTTDRNLTNERTNKYRSTGPIQELASTFPLTSRL